MQFLEHMYISENIRESQEQIRMRLSAKKPAGGWFILAVSTMRGGMLDILPARTLRQTWFDSRGLQVVGVAKGYVHAVALMEQMTMEVYKATGKCCLKEYFLAGMENDKE